MAKVLLVEDKSVAGTVHVEVVFLDGRRVPADEPRAEILHEPDEPARDALAPELAVAGEPLVGADGAEVPRARRLEPVLTTNVSIAVMMGPSPA